MPLKFRFALLTAALMLVLSVNALANSGEGAPEAPAPAQEETAEKASPFAPLRTYAGEFADVKSGDWFAPSVVSAYEYGLLSGRGNGAFAPGDNVTLAEMLTIAARLRVIYTTGGEEVPPRRPKRAGISPTLTTSRRKTCSTTALKALITCPPRARRWRASLRLLCPPNGTMSRTPCSSPPPTQAAISSPT